MTTNIEITEMPEKARDGTTIVNVSVSGALTAERYAFLENGLRKLIAKHGSIRILLVLEFLEGMTANAMREDKLFEAKQFAGIDRVAVTYATRADKRVPPSAIPFTDVKTRFFPFGEMEQALEWLKADAVYSLPGKGGRGSRCAPGGD